MANETLWCVNIKGPDDIISAPDHLSAVLMANTFNAWWLDLITKAPLTDNHPRMWAEPIEWPYSEGHGEDVTDPNNEYQWLRELTAPFLTGVTIEQLQQAHTERQKEWCPDQKPDLSFRGNEMAGEVGEACNVIKKLERERQGWRGSRATKQQLADELADVIHTAVLCAITAGIELAPAVVNKFNSTSDKNGLSTTLSALAPSPRAQALEEVALLNEAKELAFTAIARMRAAHVSCLDLTMQAENLVGNIQAAIRALSQGTSSERAQALEEGISHAIVLIDEQLEKHHDFEGDTPQSSALRDISHHLQGTLIASGEIALSHPVSPDMGVERPVEGGWLPIETAPKDGAVFLAVHPHGQVDFFHWQSRGPHIGWRDSFITVYPDDAGPKIWMPIPPLPSAPSEGAE